MERLEAITLRLELELNPKLDLAAAGAAASVRVSQEMASAELEMSQRRSAPGPLEGPSALRPSFRKRCTDWVASRGRAPGGTGCYLSERWVSI